LKAVNFNEIHVAFASLTNICAQCVIMGL